MRRLAATMAMAMAESWSIGPLEFQPHSWPADGGRGRSGVPAAKRASKKRKNVKARTKK